MLPIKKCIGILLLSYNDYIIMIESKYGHQIDNIYFYILSETTIS